jgi:hypothetical protein
MLNFFRVLHGLPTSWFNHGLFFPFWLDCVCANVGGVGVAVLVLRYLIHILAHIPRLINFTWNCSDITCNGKWKMDCNANLSLSLVSSSINSYSLPLLLLVLRLDLGSLFFFFFHLSVKRTIWFNPKC